MTRRDMPRRVFTEKEELSYARDVARAFRAWLDSADIEDGVSETEAGCHAWMAQWLEDRAHEAEEEIMKNVARLAGRIPGIDEIHRLVGIAAIADLPKRVSIPGTRQEGRTGED